MDERFYLTPVDVRQRDFKRKTIGGYDPEDVERFRGEVAEELERVLRITQDLESKAKGFHDQLRAFRERDKALNDALVSAQQLRQDMREQAEREVQLILREARAEADRILASSRGDVSRIQHEIAAVDRLRRAFVTQFRSMLERHGNELSASEAGLIPMPPGLAAAVRGATNAAASPAPASSVAAAPPVQAAMEPDRGAEPQPADPRLSGERSLNGRQDADGELPIRRDLPSWYGSNADE